MADDDSDEDVARLVADLVRTLRELEAELEPPRPEDGPRLPTPRDLRRFTSEVAVPGFILVLETNIRALRLLQRALRLAEGTDEARAETEQLRARARSASETTLSRLDGALVELQDAIEGRPNDDEAAQLLDDARELRAEIEARLRDSTRRNESGNSDGARAGETAADGAEQRETGDANGGDGAVGVDVDAELESIKRELDDLPGADGGGSGGSDADEAARDDGADESEQTDARGADAPRGGDDDTDARDDSE